MQAFAISNGIEFHHLIPLLDLVAVSIASDIVPIMGENRILAYHGLKQLNSNPSVGLKAIIDVCGLAEKEITVSDIVFKIGPRINASGRIQNGKEAVDLLTEKDFSLALEKAGQINQYNETRKDLDKTMTEEANQIVAGLEAACRPPFHRPVQRRLAQRSHRHRRFPSYGGILPSRRSADAYRRHGNRFGTLRLRVRCVQSH